MKRNVFKTPSSHKTSMDIGVLYPFQFMDVMRGQTTMLSNSALFRFQPLLAPSMVKLNAHIVSFFVPYRILWDGWNEFISGQKQSTLPTMQMSVTGGFNNIDMDFSKTLFEWVGLPTKFRVTTTSKLDVNIPFLWFMAYYKIWSDHFRDPDLQDEITIEDMFANYKKGLRVFDNDSLNNLNNRISELFQLKRVNWGRDRFTTALLETQSDPDIKLPVGANGPMQYTTMRAGDGLFSPYVRSEDAKGIVGVSTRNDGTFPSNNGGSISSADPLKYVGGLAGVDLSDFKLATAIYNFKLNQNKYGTRIEDYFRKYGIRDMDARLKNSELIGGWAETMEITDIIATDGGDLGKQGGHAKGFAQRKKLKHYAPEDGVIISMCYLRPSADYVGGVPRFFLKRDMLDFYQKEFENIGYQPIYSLEVGNSGTNAVIPEDEDQMQIFGYETRYSEYRREQSMVTGELAPGKPLAHWANPRYWATTPYLNSNFIECNPSNQIWASPNTDKAIVWFDRKVIKKCFLTKKSDPKIHL